MQVQVTKDKVTILDKCTLKIHKGEYNINHVLFEFSEEYTDDLVKVAIFKLKYGKSYQVSIINNKCSIPIEILCSVGDILLGVYAYKVNNDELELRYSPFPTYFTVISGSYDPTAEESQEITASQYEQYMQALNDGLNQVSESIKEVNQATDNANDLVDEINNKLENGDFIGPQGPQGIQGVPGKDGKDGTNGTDGIGITSITSGQSTVEEDKTITPVTVQKTDGSSQSFNVEAKNGLDGQNGQDGKDGVNGQDGLTPSIGENGNWFIGDTDTGKPSRGEVGPSPDLSEYVKNTDYAKVEQAGVIKQGNNLLVNQENGVVYCRELTLEQYNDDNVTGSAFVAKKTLQNIQDDYVASSTPVQELDNNLDNVVPKNTSSGEIVSVDDAIAYKTFNVTVDGASEQVTTTGKNLLPYPYMQSTITTAGITYTDNGDGSITISGTATGNAYLNLYGSTQSQVEIPGNYISGGANDIHVNIVNLTDSNYTVIGHSTGGFGEINKDTYNTGYVQIVVYEGATINNVTIYPMLSNEANIDWEPYTGGQASPNPDYPQEITTLTFDEITRCRKNLLPNNLTSQTINGISAIVNDDKSITINGTSTAYTTLFFVDDFILPKGTYTLSYHYKGDFPGGDVIWTIATDTENNQLLGFAIDYNSTVTFDKNTTFSKIGVAISGGKEINNLTLYPMIERGSQATEYEPYQGQTYDIDLQGNEMVELPNGVKDELVIDKQGNVSLIKNIIKKVLNGSENWLTADEGDNVNGVSAYITNVSDLYTESNNANKVFMCDKLQAITHDKAIEHNDVNFVCGGYGQIIVINIARNLLETEDIDGIKKYLQQNNVTLFYQSANPETIPLGTLSELITTLNGTNNISINGNIPTTISTTYALDIKKYIDNKLAEISTAMIEEG